MAFHFVAKTLGLVRRDSGKIFCNLPLLQRDFKSINSSVGLSEGLGNCTQTCNTSICHVRNLLIMAVSQYNLWIACCRIALRRSNHFG
jgi:hypothetical protein